MNALRSFYSKLYEGQQTHQDNDTARRFFENQITIDECEKILGSFQTGKTPGNDSIPI